MANYIIFGGTFDPVHNGHVRIALAASLRLNADIIFVPAKSPRWKLPEASAKQRYKMLKIALKNCPSGSTISKFELNSKDDVNYSINTVRYFKSKYPKDNLYLLIGADQVNRFPEWKCAEELASLSTIVYVSRPDIKLNNEIIQTYHMKDLLFVESGEVSSTDFRDLKCIDIPTDVLRYIEKEHLYFFKKIEKLIPEKRINHSIEVAKLAFQIAKINKLKNPWKYYVAGLLHDIGKTYSNESESAQTFMSKYYPEFLDFPKVAYHQFMGEYLAKVEFGINDPEILNAIKYHCTGNTNMSDLAMVIYASDKIEPTRDFDSRNLIASCLRNYKQGFIDTLIDNKKYLIEHNKDISNNLTKACFEMYIPKEIRR